MFTPKKIRIGVIILILLFIFLLTGCKGSSTDEAKVMQLVENIEKAIEEKEVDLFMENVSYDYSDPEGGTYDNHLNHLPEDIISKIELVEALLDPMPGLKVVTEVSISNLIITDPYATGKMKITISLKWCFIFCTLFPGTDDENMKYNVDFQKEADEWKIISMEEM